MELATRTRLLRASAVDAHSLHMREHPDSSPASAARRDGIATVVTLLYDTGERYGSTGLWSTEAGNPRSFRL